MGQIPKFVVIGEIGEEKLKEILEAMSQTIPSRNFYKEEGEELTLK